MNTNVCDECVYSIDSYDGEEFTGEVICIQRDSQFYRDHVTGYDICHAFRDQHVGAVDPIIYKGGII